MQALPHVVEFSGLALSGLFLFHLFPLNNFRRRAVRFAVEIGVSILLAGFIVLLH